MTAKTSYRKFWLTSAHRGMVEGVLKENTLAAFYNAYLNGADMLETDARMTRDGVLVCNHNATAVGFDPARGEVAEYAVAETDADEIVDAVLRNGMRGRVIYATNGAGTDTMQKIISRDPDARFIDTPANYTAERLSCIPDYGRRCFAYTWDFSAENAAKIRASGCMLALISLHPDNFAEAMVHHPDMCEYLHTSDFRQIETDYFDKLKLY